MKLQISEIFGDKVPTIQGEGIRIGKLSMFIRLVGCNLNCRKCDTKYADSGKIMTVKEILQKINPEIGDVVITGGEPILPQRENSLKKLLTGLSKLNKYITVETNATHILPSLLSYVSLWSLSPKLKSMAPGQDINKDVIREYVKLLGRSEVQLKFVIGQSLEGVEEMLDLLRSIPIIMVKRVPIILQPVDEKFDVGYTSTEYDIVKNYEVLISLAKDLSKYNVRVLPQLHKILWGNARGV